MTKKQKGCGSRINHCLTLEQKIKLIDWIRDNKDCGLTYEGVAAKASIELGFTVTGHSANSYWVEIHGPKNEPRSRSASKHLKAWKHNIELRIERLEGMLAFK